MARFLPALGLKGAGKWLTIGVTVAGATAGLMVNAGKLGFLSALGIQGISYADMAARRVTVHPIADTLRALGDTVMLAATVTDERGATLAGATLLWASEEISVATVDSTGVVVARGPGTTTVSVAVRDYVARSRVTVQQRLVGLTLATDSVVRLRENEFIQLESRALDPRGHVIAGLRPVWIVKDRAVASVDSTGITTGGAPGRTTITATLGSFTARVPVEVILAPARLEVVGGGSQRVPAGRTLPQPVTVRVLSRGDRPIAGVPVTFRLQDFGGTLRPSARVTDRTGRVRAAWTLGPHPGRRAITVVADGLDTTVVVEAEADPARGNIRVEVAGAPPTGRAGEAVTPPLEIQVTDSAGAAVPGVPVAWSAMDGGTIEGVNDRTDDLGRARARWTLGPKAGAQRARAHVGNPATVPAHLITAAAVAGRPAVIRLERGNGQTATVGQGLPVGVMAQVRDRFANPVPDQVVIASASGGAVDDSAETTDAAGRVSFGWTLGRAAGRQTLQLRAVGLDAVARASATGRPRAPANLAFHGPPGSVAPGRAVPVEVLVTDDYGNPVPNVQVVFAAGTGAWSATRVATDQKGMAGSRWTAPRVAGETQVMATVRNTSIRNVHPIRVAATRR